MTIHGALQEHCLPLYTWISQGCSTSDCLRTCILASIPVDAIACEGLRTTVLDSSLICPNQIFCSVCWELVVTPWTLQSCVFTLWHIVFSKALSHFVIMFTLKSQLKKNLLWKHLYYYQGSDHVQLSQELWLLLGWNEVLFSILSRRETNMTCI